MGYVMEMLLPVLLLIGWLVLAVFVAFLAEARGRSHFGWLVFSIGLSPLLGLILVLALPAQGDAVLARDESGQIITVKTHVRCPDCRELVRADARKCKHCGIALIPQS